MQLVLTVGNKVLDRVDLNPKLFKNDGYLQALKRLMLVKHETKIAAHRSQPTVYMEVASKIGVV